jgi:hypothetical protein
MNDEKYSQGSREINTRNTFEPYSYRSVSYENEPSLQNFQVHPGGGLEHDSDLRILGLRY